MISVMSGVKDYKQNFCQIEKLISGDELHHPINSTHGITVLDSNKKKKIGQIFWRTVQK